MIEHISLSFPPYCGIFNSTDRESSAVRFFSPHHRSTADTSCVTGLPARSKHRSCRIFLPFISPSKNSIHMTLLLLSGLARSVRCLQPNQKICSTKAYCRPDSHEKKGALLRVKPQNGATPVKQRDSCGASVTVESL
jgi:hypothetical protein